MIFHNVKLKIKKYMKISHDSALSVPHSAQTKTIYSDELTHNPHLFFHIILSYNYLYKFDILQDAKNSCHYF
jgi:hypothetical protein